MCYYRFIYKWKAQSYNLKADLIYRTSCKSPGSLYMFSQIKKYSFNQELLKDFSRSVTTKWPAHICWFHSRANGTSALAGTLPWDWTVAEVWPLSNVWKGCAIEGACWKSDRPLWLAQWREDDGPLLKAYAEAAETVFYVNALWRMRQDCKSWTHHHSLPQWLSARFAGL